MDPLDEPNLPKFPFSKEDFTALRECARYLRRYASWWRAVFANLAVLIVIALIARLICNNFDLNKPGPLWLYVLVLALLMLGLYHGQNFFIYLYDGLRHMPIAIKTKRSQRALTLKWRGQMSAWDAAYEEQLMAKVIKQMDPKDVEELRKHGFL